MTSPLKIGFNLPFAEAIKAAQQRNVVLPEKYFGELQGMARQLAFSVAGLTSLDQLTVVRDSLAAKLQSGQTFREWQKDMLESGTLDLPKHRLDNIFRTNIQSAYNRGRWERFVAVKDERPYLMYDAINDSRVRPAHLAMDGIIRPVDDPFWDSHAPLNGYRSILPNQRVSGNVLLGLKANYSGKAVEIMLQSGGTITVTAQHPILTNIGWVMSNKIKIGDKLACYGGEVTNSAPAANLDKDNLPPTIEEVFNTLSTHIRTTAPRATVNLYGDVEFIDGDVDIVGADRELMRQIDATTRQFMDQIKLTLSNKTIANAPGFSPFVRIFPAASFLGSFRRFFSPFRYFFSTVIAIPFGLGGHGDSIIGKKLRNSFSADVQFSSDTLNSPPAQVHIYDAFWYWLQEFRSRLSDQLSTCNFTSLSFGSFESSITDVFIGSFGINADALGSIRHAHPGKVKFDNVVDVRLFDYRGHVYDLETKSGNILAYGGECNNHYILSNCRCRLISLSESQAQKRSVGDKGLNQPETDKMNPDKGWDYNPGKDLLEGVNRAIADRQGKASPVLLSALDKKLSSMKIREFVPSKTAKEAGKWAVDNNLVDYADYSGVKVEIANAFNQSLFEHISEFPELRKNQEFIGTIQAQFARFREQQIARYMERLRKSNPGVSDDRLRPFAEKAIKLKKTDNRSAQSWTQPGVKGISINKKWGSDPIRYKSALEHSEVTRHHPDGCGIFKADPDHEFGHQLDALLGLTKDKEMESLFEEFRLKGDKHQLSAYALTDIGEFIAEGWSEFRNNKTAGTLAIKIGDIVLSRYRGLSNG